MEKTASELKLPLENPLWEFSVKQYQQAALAEAALQLQNTSGANINVLLLCCWFSVKSIELTQERLRTLLDGITAWEKQAVLPLRNVRQQIKSMELVGFSVSDFRDKVKALELLAEQYEIAGLYALSKDWLPAEEKKRGPVTVVKNLQTYANEMNLDGELVSNFIRQLNEAN